MEMLGQQERIAWNVGERLLERGREKPAKEGGEYEHPSLNFIRPPPLPFPCRVVESGRERLEKGLTLGARARARVGGFETGILDRRQVVSD